MSDPGKAVFLSYASQDAEAAKRIADALRAAGVEVWFDQSELVGGDAWDQKIRRQIKECALFIPILSQTTQGRREAYFRLEWKLADERTHLMARGTPFLLPVTIDDTNDRGALVPDSFLAVQWTKLPGGETPPAFAARVQKLIEGDLAGGAGPGQIGRGESPGSTPPATASLPKWIRPILASAAIVIAVLAYTLVSRRESAPTIVPPAVPTPGPAGVAAAVSPARELVAKAYVLLRGLDATREDFALAEEYCQRAMKRDPDDGEVWAAYSQVHAAFAYRGWDSSPERREQARVTAERAIRLLPHSVNARLAQAGAWAAFGVNRDEREKLLRQVVREEPDNQGALRFLAVTVLGGPGGLEECLAINERSAALPGGDPLALFNNARYLWQRGRLDEGYATLQRALAGQKFTSGLVLKMAMEINWRGDLAAAEETLRQLPPAALLEDRANYEAGLLHYYLRDAAAALATWQAFPRDFYNDFVYDGPKGLLLGLADELDHRDVAARTEWRAALIEVEKKIAAAPNKPGPYYSQAYLLACLGEKPAANDALRTYEQLAGIKYGPGQPMPIGLPQIYARLGRFDEIFAHPPVGLAILRVSPDFDALRNDPRFQALIAPEKQRTENGGPKTAQAVDEKSVAVLAFANLSDDKANEYFSDGISEELLTVLQKIPGLKVSARTSAFSFKGRDVSVQEIGKTLGVAHLVDGSVRKAGGKVRITARLSRTDTGQQLWSESYTRDVDDVFKLQTELAQTIVAQLKEQLTGGKDVDKDDVASQVTAAQKGGTTNVAAHELYLQGRYFANQPSIANLGKAVDFLQRAVDLDPAFALAWAALARNLAVQAEYLDTTPETLREAFARARRAADRAVALAPKLPDGYFARNEIQSAYDYDWQGARESLNLALSLAPADALLVSNASQLAAQFGDVPRSLELGRRAVELDPVNAEIRYWLGRIYLSAGLLAEGEAELRRAADLSPSLLSVHRQIATALVLQNRAAAAVEEARLEKEEWSRQAALAVACWAAKDVPGANAALARLIEVASESAAFQVAEAHAVRGESDQAFEWLERAYRNRDSGFGQLRMDPLLKSLYADPRWRPLLQQAGLAGDHAK